MEGGRDQERVKGDGRRRGVEEGEEEWDVP